MNNRNYFSVMVVGEEPDKLIKQFSKEITVDDYIVYKKNESKRLQENEINVLTKLKNLGTLSELQDVHISARLEKIQNMNEDEYFFYLTENMKKDSEGNAVSNVNPNGKYNFCTKARRFAIPFKLFDDTETFQARYEDINWNKMHMYNSITYETVWEIFKEGREPKTEEEITLYNNMLTLNNYFDKFNSKDEYVIYNTAFFHYAYVDEKNGWIDMDDENDSVKWITEFYDRFVAPLNNTDLITIYECRDIDR